VDSSALDLDYRKASERLIGYLPIWHVLDLMVLGDAEVKRLIRFRDELDHEVFRA
jgi:hypothetical protein